MSYLGGPTREQPCVELMDVLDTTLERLPRPGESSDCRWKGVPVNCGPRGLPTGYIQGANFGKATSDTQYISPVPGTNGLRMWRMALGFRF